MYKYLKKYQKGIIDRIDKQDIVNYTISNGNVYVADKNHYCIVVIPEEYNCINFDNKQCRPMTALPNILKGCKETNSIIIDNMDVIDVEFLDRKTIYKFALKYNEQYIYIDKALLDIFSNVNIHLLCGSSKSAVLVLDDYDNILGCIMPFNRK